MCWFIPFILCSKHNRWGERIISCVLNKFCLQHQKTLCLLILLRIQTFCCWGGSECMCTRDRYNKRYVYTTFSAVVLSVYAGAQSLRIKKQKAEVEGTPFWIHLPFPFLINVTPARFEASNTFHIRIIYHNNYAQILRDFLAAQKWFNILSIVCDTSISKQKQNITIFS